MPERQVKICLVTFVVVATSVIQLATTRSGATVVGLETRVLLSGPCRIITFSSDQHHKKRQSLSSSSKDNTLSDEMFDNSSRELHFLSEQNFRGFFLISGQPCYFSSQKQSLAVHAQNDSTCSLQKTH